MVYNPHPPYEILQNKLISFADMQRMRRFSRYWDLVANSGNFVESTPLLWQNSGAPFASFMRWSDWLQAQVGRSHSIALLRLAECLFDYLTKEQGRDRQGVAETIWRDYQRGGRNDQPVFLRPYLTAESLAEKQSSRLNIPKRQARHLSENWS